MVSSFWHTAATSHHRNLRPFLHSAYTQKTIMIGFVLQLRNRLRVEKLKKVYIYSIFDIFNTHKMIQTISAFVSHTLWWQCVCRLGVCVCWFEDVHVWMGVCGCVRTSVWCALNKTNICGEQEASQEPLPAFTVCVSLCVSVYTSFSFFPRSVYTFMHVSVCVHLHMPSCVNMCECVKYMHDSVHVCLCADICVYYMPGWLASLSTSPVGTHMVKRDAAAFLSSN